MQKKKLAAFLIGLFAITALSIFGVRYLFFPRGPAGSSITMVVPKGASLRAIADSLAIHKIVTSRVMLLAWLRVSGIERKIQAGKFTFVTHEGALSAAKKLTHAEPNDKAVTIPEGFTIEQTAARVRNVFPIDTTAFISLCRDSQFIRATLPFQVQSLEGYLFPDTYRFAEGTLPAEMIGNMVAHFSEVYRRLDFGTRVPQELTEQEVVTLASIVEKEAMLAEERPRIAAVFLNRLKIGWPLGADPTVRYILKKFDGPLLASELAVNSPYNTRKFKGLPPGPICSPGIASIQAVISPSTTNELYFVARWDGSGAHDFSRTNEEHTRKKMLIRKQNRMRLDKKEQ